MTGGLIVLGVLACGIVLEAWWKTKFPGDR
jgi:hypothetical protein